MPFVLAPAPRTCSERFPEHSDDNFARYIVPRVAVLALTLWPHCRPFFFLSRSTADSPGTNGSVRPITSLSVGSCIERGGGLGIASKTV